MTAARAPQWHDVCAESALDTERGAAAYVDGIQVALFRDHAGMLYAIDNRDPFTGAYVLARGIVGSRGTRTTVASPLHKQVFDLATGECLADASVSVPVYGVRRNGTTVQVCVRR